MPWVIFNEKFDFIISPRAMVSYKKGKYLVSQACAAAAVAAGKAEYAERDALVASAPNRRRTGDAGR